MTANPEQPILDAIDELVEWQLEEGRKRGDGQEDPVAAMLRVLSPKQLADISVTIAVLEQLRSGMRRPVEVPEDAPYQEWREFEPGERVGWQLADGTVRVGVVEEHREYPPGSGCWTMAIEDDPRRDISSGLFERVADVLAACDPWVRRTGPGGPDQQATP